MPSQERALRTRELMLDAAAAEFDQYGFAGARIDRIVERSGLTKGAFYFHFPSKAEVAEALLFEKMEAWAPLIDEIRAAYSGEAAARAVSHMAIGRLVRDVRARVGMRLSRELPNAEISKAYDIWAQVLGEFLAQGQESGELNGAFNPQRAAYIAVRAIFGAYSIAVETSTVDALDGDIDQFWDYYHVMLAPTR